MLPPRRMEGGRLTCTHTHTLSLQSIITGSDSPSRRAGGSTQNAPSGPQTIMPFAALRVLGLRIDRSIDRCGPASSLARWLGCACDCDWRMNPLDPTSQLHDAALLCWLVSSSSASLLGQRSKERLIKLDALRCGAVRFWEPARLGDWIGQGVGEAAKGASGAAPLPQTLTDPP